MTHVGHSNFVVAESEEIAIAKAIADLAARKGLTAFEVPLFVEDLGEGEWEVVLRERISEAVKVAEAFVPDGSNTMISQFIIDFDEAVRARRMEVK